MLFSGERRCPATPRLQRVRRRRATSTVSVPRALLDTCRWRIAPFPPLLQGAIRSAGSGLRQGPRDQSDRALDHLPGKPNTARAYDSRASPDLPVHRTGRRKMLGTAAREEYAVLGKNKALADADKAIVLKSDDVDATCSGQRPAKTGDAASIISRPRIAETTAFRSAPRRSAEQRRHDLPVDHDKLLPPRGPTTATADRRISCWRSWRPSRHRMPEPPPPALVPRRCREQARPRRRSREGRPPAAKSHRQRPAGSPVAERPALRPHGDADDLRGLTPTGCPGLQVGLREGQRSHSMHKRPAGDRPRDA